MNTPTEFLEGIHAALEKLPEELSAAIKYQPADLPTFAEPAGIDMQAEDISAPPSTTPDMPDYPEFGQSMGQTPEFPSQGSYSIGEAEFPSPESPSFKGAEAGFPDLAGFGSIGSSLPTNQSAEYDLEQKTIDLLEEISRNTSPSRGGGSSANGFQRSAGPQQTPDRSVYIRDRNDPVGIPNKTLLSHRFENGN